MPSVVGPSTGAAPYVGSLASGLDTAALIEAAVAQRTAPADAIEARIIANEARIGGYQQLQALVTSAAESLAALAAPAYSALGATNAFDAKQVFLSGAPGTTPGEAIAVSASDEAIAAAYEIEIVQRASAMKLVGASLDGVSPLGLSGVFSIGLDGGALREIAVNASMNLSDVAAAINAAAPGVSATLIRVSGETYRLALSAGAAAVNITATAVSGDDVMAGIGLTDQSGGFANVVQQAQSAIVRIDGVEIVRDSNELDDVIPGLGVSLLAGSEGQTISVNVEADYEAVKTAITGFVAAYNGLRAFVTAQNQVSATGVVADDAVLFADSLLRNMSSLVRGLMSSSMGDGAVSSLSDLGLTFSADNSLSLTDESGLDSLILTDIASIQSYFETAFEATDPALRLISNSSTRSLDFSLHVETSSDGAITRVLADGVENMFAIEGARLVGVDGTAYEGLVFALVMTGEADIGVSLRQGFANRLANLLDAYADPASGLIAAQVQSVMSADAILQAQADRIRDAAGTYRQNLVDKYAAMEIEVQAAQLLQQQIEAILNAAAEDT